MSDAADPRFDDGPLFDDGKDAAAMRTIGEVATAFGIRQHVLRYWEQQFPMLRPLKRSGGRRYYRPGDVALVETIDRLINREGYTLKGARQAIEKGQGGSKPAHPELVEGRPPAASAGAVSVLPQLRAIRQRLADALAA
jgi:DNA-binding transcriptional MerR regulator